MPQKDHVGPWALVWLCSLFRAHMCVDSIFSDSLVAFTFHIWLFPLRQVISARPPHSLTAPVSSPELNTGHIHPFGQAKPAGSPCLYKFDFFGFPSSCYIFQGGSGADSRFGLGDGTSLGANFYCKTELCSDITNTLVGISGETAPVARISIFIE